MQGEATTPLTQASRLDLAIGGSSFQVDVPARANRDPRLRSSIRRFAFEVRPVVLLFLFLSLVQHSGSGVQPAHSAFSRYSKRLLQSRLTVYSDRPPPTVHDCQCARHPMPLYLFRRLAVSAIQFPASCPPSCPK